MCRFSAFGDQVKQTSYLSRSFLRTRFAWGMSTWQFPLFFVPNGSGLSRPSTSSSGGGPGPNDGRAATCETNTSASCAP